MNGSCNTMAVQVCLRMVVATPWLYMCDNEWQLQHHGSAGMFMNGSCTNTAIHVF